MHYTFEVFVMRRVNEFGYGWTNTTATGRGKYHWLEHGYRVCDTRINATHYPALWGYVFDGNDFVYACQKCLSSKRSYLRTVQGQINRLRVLMGRNDVLA